MQTTAREETFVASGRVPRTEKGRLRVELLKETARNLIAEHGYEATTMTAIASAAKVSIGSLYQYFPARHHIVRELEKDGLRDILACLSVAGEDGASASDLATAVFDALVAYSERNPAFKLVCERHDIDSTDRKWIHDAICAQIAGRFRQAQPPLSPSRAMVAAILVLYLSNAMHTPGPAADNSTAHILMRSEIRRMLRLYLQDLD